MIKMSRVLQKIDPNPRLHQSNYGYHKPAQRASVVTLKEEGYVHRYVTKRTGVPQSSVSNIYKRAKDRQIELHKPLNTAEVYEDRPKSGRPCLMSESDKDRIFERVIATPENRRKKAQDLIKDIGLQGQRKKKTGEIPPMSRSFFNRIMRGRGYYRGKRGWKPFLTVAHKQKRLNWARRWLEFEWTRRAVSSDEAIARRGEPYRGRLWMHHGEELDEDIVGRKNTEDNKAICSISGHLAHGRKGTLVFLFQETKEQKIIADTELEKENAGFHQALEEEFVAEQELKEQIRSSQGKKKRGGKAPSFEVWERKKRLTRGDRHKGGLDGYRYREEVLKPHLIPFCERLNEEGRNVIVMQDCAGNHTSRIPKDYFKLKCIDVFWDWPPLSPDLNPIERAWDWCRRYLQDKDFHAETNQELVDGWNEAWDALPLDLVNSWFEEMRSRLQKVIQQKGDNLFHA